MKTHIILGLSALFLASCSFQPKPSPEELFQKSMAFYAQAEGIKYDLEHSHKYFTDSDTLIKHSSIEVVKAVSDTIIGFMIQSSTEEKIRSFARPYEHVIDIKKDSGRIFLEDDPNLLYYQRQMGAAIYSFFFQKQSVIEQLNDSGRVVTIFEDLVDDTPCWVLQIDEPEEYDLFTQWKCFYYFNKKDFRLEQYVQTNDVLSSFNYDCWKYTKQDFKITEDQFLTNRIALSKVYHMDTSNYIYAKDVIAEKEDQFIKRLPQVSLYDVRDSTEIQFTDFKGKPTIVDFWFMACAWCYKGFPHMNELHAKYKEECNVVGLNPYDAGKDFLQKYMSDLDMQYPSYFVRSTVFDSLRVNGFPYYFVFDKSGKMVFQQSGYHDSLVVRIDSVLNTLQ
ncbi:MAG: thiol-disulfide isomerase/thioredoxin [Flavobacteriales bacterium]|jgi:thiol-disulfide isomerase/thioredoxin